MVGLAGEPVSSCVGDVPSDVATRCAPGNGLCVVNKRSSISIPDTQVRLTPPLIAKSHISSGFSLPPAPQNLSCLYRAGNPWGLLLCLPTGSVGSPVMHMHFSRHHLLAIRGNVFKFKQAPFERKFWVQPHYQVIIEVEIYTSSLEKNVFSGTQVEREDSSFRR